MAVEIVVLAALFVIGLPLLIAAVAAFSDRPVRPKPERARRDSAAKALWLTVLLWVVLTAVGEAITASVDFYPLVLSDKGEDIASAFRLLMYLSVPVFTLVLAVLVYSLLRRGFENVPEDGPPLQGRGTAPLVWFAATAALTALVIVHPGLTSLHAVTKEPDRPDLVIMVEGMQWTWLVSYPELGISQVRELALPVDRDVRFEITSRDVLHSFWIPAFLMKVDAVPGLTTTMSLRATQTGDIAMDPTVRLQCAELCGVSHTTMQIPVSVLSQRDFDAWARQQSRPAARTESNEPLRLAAHEGSFETRQFSVSAGGRVSLVLENRDEGLSHSWALYDNERAANQGAAPIFASDPLAAGSEAGFAFVLSRSGTYFFRCETHPETMTGLLAVN